ncbi:hypothetical protein G6F22_020038 [Rhizopus arrhizus]|nr:hypothetical protein G6F22_020038 [Rhizopus arrhizus]
MRVDRACTRTAAGCRDQQRGTRTMNSTANATLPPRAKPAGQVDPATLAALASGLHADPFAVLGPHEGVVRTLAPGAAAVWVVAQDGQRVALQEQAHGLYTGTAPRARPGQPGHA